MRPPAPTPIGPDDTALGYLDGILAGADKLSRVAWVQSDPAIAEVLGVSQPGRPADYLDNTG